jgi:hypothetical protein
MIHKVFSMNIMEAAGVFVNKKYLIITQLKNFVNNYFRVKRYADAWGHLYRKHQVICGS